MKLLLLILIGALMFVADGYQQGSGCYSCSGSLCLDISKVCDNSTDCPDNYDETEEACAWAQCYRHFCPKFSQCTIRGGIPVCTKVIQKEAPPLLCSWYSISACNGDNTCGNNITQTCEKSPYSYCMAEWYHNAEGAITYLRKDCVTKKKPLELVSPNMCVPDDAHKSCYCQTSFCNRHPLLPKYVPTPSVITTPPTKNTTSTTSGGARTIEIAVSVSCFSLIMLLLLGGTLRSCCSGPKQNDEQEEQEIELCLNAAPRPLEDRMYDRIPFPFPERVTAETSFTIMPPSPCPSLYNSSNTHPSRLLPSLSTAANTSFPPVVIPYSGIPL